MTFETNCLVIASHCNDWIVQILGERFWNDHEDIRCIPQIKLKLNELKAIAEKLAFTVEYLQTFEYIIIEGRD